MSLCRKELWGALTISTTIVLASTIGNHSRMFDFWTLVLAFIALIVAVTFTGIYLSAVASLQSVKGSLTEVVALHFPLLFWLSYVSFRHSIGNVFLDGNEINYIKNANEYFCSWISLLLSILLYGSTLQAFLQIDVSETSATLATRFNLWILLSFCSFVVMASSSFILRDLDCSSGKCSRHKNYTILTIVISMLSFAISSLCLIFKIRKSVALIRDSERKVPILIFCSYAATMYYITGKDGPGHSTNSVFYFSWLCLAISVYLSFHCQESYDSVLPLFQKIGLVADKNTQNAENTSINTRDSIVGLRIPQREQMDIVEECSVLSSGSKNPNTSERSAEDETVPYGVKGCMKVQGSQIHLEPDADHELDADHEPDIGVARLNKSCPHIILKRNRLYRRDSENTPTTLPEYCVKNVGDIIVPNCKPSAVNRKFSMNF